MFIHRRYRHERCWFLNAKAKSLLVGNYFCQQLHPMHIDHDIFKNQNVSFEYDMMTKIRLTISLMWLVDILFDFWDFKRSILEWTCSGLGFTKWENELKKPIESLVPAMTAKLTYLSIQFTEWDKVGHKWWVLRVKQNAIK